MHIPRIYSANALLSGQETRLDAQASSHLLRVLRLKPTEKLRIFDGVGREFSAVLSGIDKKLAVIRILEPYPAITESSLHIHLGQAISRNEKMDYSIQKAVELGVQKITPLFTQRSGVNLTDERLEKRLLHWRSVIISACEQCGRNVLPMLAPPMGIENWLKQCTESLRFILDPAGNLHLRSLVVAEEQIVVAVGPESGFSQEELQLAKQTGFYGLNLGPRILRTETAGPAVLSAFQTLWGDMG
jgi:16S rRNA (uracil1498-N3)-methyltransferase